MRWDSTWNAEEINVYRILEGGESTEGNRSDGLRAEWAIVLHRILNILNGKMEWIHTAQERDKFSALVYMARAFVFHKMLAIYWLTKKIFFSPGSAPSVTLDNR
jgi:hypothetical protein